MIIALYGKGGIGKSTIASNISALLGKKGKRVLQVGCDPKHDSTFILARRFIRTVSEVLIEKEFDLSLITAEDIIFQGSFGTHIMEIGGPEAGKGCGGYVVGDTIEILKRLKVFENYDHIIFDVLGDVVCGGFAVPLNLADLVYVVTGDDFNSIFAANRINAAIIEKSRYYPVRAGGIIGNKCEKGEFLNKFCRLTHSKLIVNIPYSDAFQSGSQGAKTLQDMEDSKELVSYFEKIVAELQEDNEGYIPDTVSDDTIFAMFSIKPEVDSEHKA